MTPFDLPTHMSTGTYSYSPTQAYRTPLFHTVKQSIALIMKDDDSRNIGYFLMINLTYMCIQLTYGVWTNSLGLISDSIHMFFDCLALSIGLYASVMSQWPSNREYTYGYHRIETLAAYFNGLFLIFISLSITAEAIKRLIYPPEMNTHRLLIVSILGLIVNLIGIFAFNHGHVHSCDHEHTHNGHSDNMKGVFLHIVADTLGSCGVIVSTVLIEWFGWTGFDPLASLLIAILIFISVLPLVKQASAVMMLELEDDQVAMVEYTLEEIKRLEGVCSVTHSRFWPYEKKTMIGSMHVQVMDNVDTQNIKKTVMKLLHHHLVGLKEVCVQIELYSTVKKNNMPQKGFFHTPMYTSPHHSINHRPAYHSLPSNTLPESTQPSLMSVLHKQRKKE